MDFLSQNSYSIVLGVVLIIWIVIFSYLARIDKKITRLEKK